MAPGVVRVQREAALEAPRRLAHVPPIVEGLALAVEPLDVGGAGGPGGAFLGALSAAAISARSSATSGAQAGCSGAGSSVLQRAAEADHRPSSRRALFTARPAAASARHVLRRLCASAW